MYGDRRVTWWVGLPRCSYSLETGQNEAVSGHKAVGMDLKQAGLVYRRTFRSSTRHPFPPPFPASGEGGQTAAFDPRGAGVRTIPLPPDVSVFSSPRESRAFAA